MIQYKIIGLLYTRTCPLSCRHCITDSSPTVKGKMAMEHALEYLQAIPRFSPVVGFTGGEPLLFHREVAELTAHARALGLQVSVVTGAGWVKREADARSRLEALAQAGLTRLWISWDQYHEAFSPRERVIMLARLSIEVGLPVTIRSVLSAGTNIEELRTAFGDLPVHFDSVQIAKLGRARSLDSSHFSWDESAPKGTCGVVLQPVVQPDGTVYACCGPSLYAAKGSPLILGNAREEPLESILDRAVQNPLLEVIRNLGPYGLYRLLQGHPLGRQRFKPRTAYSGICDLCLDIINDPELVAAVQERLLDPDAKALLAASSLWWKRRIEPHLWGQHSQQQSDGCIHDKANHAG